MVAPRSNNLRPVEKYHYDIFIETEQNYITKTFPQISQPIL